MRQPYPEIEPDESGLLDVGDGHRIHWEASGAPGGKPAVVLHGGPGSGCGPWWRRLLDPRVYRIVLFDQRGCGRSVPHASVPDVDLATNTTHHLVADIELLRRRLSIERWLVLGGSWGSTLALEAYNRLLLDPDPAVHQQAARDWCAWEDAHVRTRPGDPPDPRYQDPAFRLCFARLVTHYWRHAAWLEDGALLRGVEKLTGIPAVLIHGRLDLSSPSDVPWMLAASWENCELVVIDDASHTGGPNMTAAIVSATDGFANPG